MVGLFSVLFVVAVILVIGGLVIHMLMFGTIFYKITRHVSQSLDEQSAQRDAARSALTCSFCGGARTEMQSPCPACGAPPEPHRSGA